MSKMRQASLKRMKIFVRIADFGNFNDVARELHLTPSAISQSLKLLEDELGVSLIKRTTRSLILTDAGNYFYNHMKNVLSDLDNIYSNAINYNKEPNGELKITCSVAFGYTHMRSLVYEFSEKYNNVNININLSDHLVNLNEEDYDIALRISRFPPVNFSMRKLCPINWVYCASTRYLEKYGTPTTIENLRKHHLLMYPDMNATLKKIDDIKPLKSIKSNCSLFSLQAVLDNKGIAYLPLYLLEDKIKRGQIIPLKLTDQLVYKTHNLYALYFPSRYSNPRIRTFIDFLIDKFSYEGIWSL